jgi:hypothetical protein
LQTTYKPTLILEVKAQQITMLQKEIYYKGKPYNSPPPPKTKGEERTLTETLQGKAP